MDPRIEALGQEFPGAQYLLTMHRERGRTDEETLVLLCLFFALQLRQTQKMLEDHVRKGPPPVVVVRKNHGR